MRRRILSPGFFTNEVLTALPPLARLAFQGLWLNADKEGRLEDRPRRLRVTIFPYEQLSDDEFDALLALLARDGFIKRYEVSGERYIAIEAFVKHQRPHPKEAASLIPAPPKQEESRRRREKNGPSREKVRPSREESMPDPPFPSGSSGSSGSSEEPAADAAAVVPAKAPRGRAGTAEQQAAIDRCSAILGVVQGHNKTNVQAVEAARKHYSAVEVVAILTAIRHGSTSTAMWCQERLPGLSLEYMLRPGKNGAADRILEQLARGDGPPRRAGPPPSDKARRHLAEAQREILAGCKGDGTLNFGGFDDGQGVGRGDGEAQGVLSGS